MADRDGGVRLQRAAAPSACRRSRCGRPRRRARRRARPRARRAAPSRRAASPGRAPGGRGRARRRSAGGSRRRPSPESTARITCVLVDVVRAAAAGRGSRRPRRRRSARRAARAAPPPASRPAAAGPSASKPASVAALCLQADVDVGGRIVADEHGHEPDVADRRHLLGHLGADPLGERLALHQSSRTCGESRLRRMRWPRKNDAGVDRARAARAMGVDGGLTTSVDLEPFARRRRVARRRRGDPRLGGARRDRARQPTSCPTDGDVVETGARDRDRARAARAHRGRA